MNRNGGNKLAKNERIVNMSNYKKKNSWNIGVFVFFIVFLYLAVTIITYVTKDRIAVYEVREGSILKDTSYTGIVLREERIITADADGFINYFTEAGQKVAVGKQIYTLSTEKLDTNVKVESEEVELSAEEISNIEQKAQSFNKTFRKESFNTATTFKQEVSSILQSKTTQNRVGQLKDLLKENGDLTVYQAKEDGIIQYSTDGLETLTLEDVTVDLVNKVNYQKSEMINNTEISAGDPVYRLITDESWKVVFPLDQTMEEQLTEKMGDRDWANLRVRFLKDNEIMTGVFQIYKKDEDVYGYLSFSTSMIRYAEERYLDIELILEDETGLKIPKSAVTEKEFYVVPVEYLTNGGSSTETGVLRQSTDKSGNTITEFVPVTIFYQDEEKGNAYLEPSDFKANDILIMPESAQTLKLSEKGVLQGVFNINKGYAVFKRIEILCESEEYYIIEEGSSYGLSNYDRIALDGSSIVEGQLINQ